MTNLNGFKICDPVAKSEGTVRSELRKIVKTVSDALSGENLSSFSNAITAATEEFLKKHPDAKKPEEDKKPGNAKKPEEAKK